MREPQAPLLERALPRCTCGQHPLVRHRPVTVAEKPYQVTAPGGGTPTQRNNPKYPEIVTLGP